MRWEMFCCRLTSDCTVSTHDRSSEVRGHPAVVHTLVSEADGFNDQLVAVPIR